MRGAAEGHTTLPVTRPPGAALGGATPPAFRIVKWTKPNGIAVHAIRSNLELPRAPKNKCMAKAGLPNRLFRARPPGRARRSVKIRCPRTRQKQPGFLPRARLSSRVVSRGDPRLSSPETSRTWQPHWPPARPVGCCRQLSDLMRRIARAAGPNDISTCLSCRLADSAAFRNRMLPRTLSAGDCGYGMPYIVADAHGDGRNHLLRG